MGEWEKHSKKKGCVCVCIFFYVGYWIKKKGKYSESECVVCIFFMDAFFFYGKIEKNKEEFNILICSRSRIINLHVSRISNIRWKYNF